ncbi:single-stranded DNA-binding protein [Sarcina ventriculi]
MNNVQLVGRLTKDPDLRYTAVARFSVAVKKKIKDAEGNYGADFINCVAYGKIAENIANFFTKGREIAVVGSLMTGSYEDKQGVKRYTTDVKVDTFDFIGIAPKNNTQATGFNNNGTMIDDMMPIDEGDMPF